VGAVLAMSAMVKGVVAAAVLATLGGCGDQFQGGLLLPLASRAVPSLTGGGNGVQPTLQPGFTPQEMAADLESYMIIGVPTLGPPIPVRRIMDNGTAETWLAQVGFTAAFVDGMLVATRGLGSDLMAANTGAVRRALAAGGGTAQRAMDVMDDQDRITTLQFECEIVATGTETIDLGLRQVATRTFEENCASAKAIFTNLYWLDSAGEIVQSRQLVSPTVAYLRSNRL